MADSGGSLVSLIDPLINPLGGGPSLKASAAGTSTDAVIAGGLVAMQAQTIAASGSPTAPVIAPVNLPALATGGNPTQPLAAGPLSAPQAVPLLQSGSAAVAPETEPEEALEEEGAVAAPQAAPQAVAPLPATLPATLAPANAAIGTSLSAGYSAFAGQFQIRIEDLRHLLKLANPARYGAVFATDINGKSYEVSGVRTIDSYGNNLSNAGIDGLYGTADDIKAGQAGYLSNSQGIGAERWANAETPFIRLANPNWGTNPAGLELPGKPTGYRPGFAVDTAPSLAEPLHQLLPNSRLVSNALGSQTASMPNSAGWNIYDMSFGQYFNHGLASIARSGLDQSIAARTAPGDPLNGVSGGRVGVLGDRGALYLLAPQSHNLVQVAHFSAGPSGAAAGLYSFSLDAAGKPLPLLSAEQILGRKLLDTDVLTKNKTEALIQLNQLYGSTEATAYVLRESARFDASGVYRNSEGIEYRIGGSVGGLRVLGRPGGLVKLVDNKAPGGFQLLKTARMLQSRVITGDGLPGLPTYAEVLLNNGVKPLLVDAVFKADGGNGASLTSPEWLALSQDPRFISIENVRNFNPASKGYLSLSGQPLIDDVAVSINAENNSTDFARLAAIDQNVDGIADVLRLMPLALARQYLPQSAQLNDAQLQAELNNQTPILSEDWGAGQLLSHIVTGDWRANENIGLSTIHTMWAREHDFQVENIRTAAREFGITGISEEDLFQSARILLEGEYQKLIYEEFAPSLAGPAPGPGPHGWAGYNPNVDASISLEFSVAAFRVGHSQIPQELLPGFGMFNSFLNPQLFLGLGESAIQAGLVQKAHEAIDTLMTNGVRNELATRNLDLFTTNVLRSREQGLPSLNGLRRELYTNGPANLANATDVAASFKGNPIYKPYASWEEFGANLRDWQPGLAADGTPLAFQADAPASYGSSALLDKFKALYQSVEDVDLWVGMLAEKPTASTGQMGALMAGVFWEQLDRQQEGDRYYYIDRLNSDGSIALWNELDSIRDIMARTSAPELVLPNKNAFKVQSSNDLLSQRDAYIASAIGVGDQLRSVTSLFTGADPWANLQPFTLNTTPALIA